MYSFSRQNYGSAENILNKADLHFGGIVPETSKLRAVLRYYACILKLEGLKCQISTIILKSNICTSKLDNG